MTVKRDFRHKNKRLLYLGAGAVLSVFLALYTKSSLNYMIPIHIYESDYFIIGDLTTGKEIKLNTEELFAIHNDEDMNIVHINFDVLNIRANDFSKDYKITFYSSNRYPITATICKIEKALINQELNLYRGMNHNNNADNPRKYFYDMDDAYYALKIKKDYISFSEYQSELLSEIFRTVEEL